MKTLLVLLLILVGFVNGTLFATEPPTITSYATPRLVGYDQPDFWK